MLPRGRAKGNLATSCASRPRERILPSSATEHVAHVAGAVAQPSASRDIRHDRHLPGGEAASRRGRGCDRPRGGRAGFPHPVDSRRRRRAGDSGGEDPLPGERGDPRAPCRGGEASLAALRRAARERRSRRHLQRLEAVAVQRLLQSVRPGGRGGDPCSCLGVVSPDRAPHARAARARARRSGVESQGGGARSRARGARGPGVDPVLALQSDRRRLHARRDQGDRAVGRGAQGVGDHRRDLPAHPLRSGTGPVVPGW